jgi:hypothetical protein
VHIFELNHLILFQRYEIVNGVVEVDDISKNAAEGKESNGTK